MERKSLGMRIEAMARRSRGGRHQCAGWATGMRSRNPLRIEPLLRHRAGGTYSDRVEQIEQALAQGGMPRVDGAGRRRPDCISALKLFLLRFAPYQLIYPE